MWVSSLRSEARPAVVRDGVIVALCLVLAGYLLANLIAFHYGRDQGIYALVARRMLHGVAPYQGTWDFKPPGIFFVFALAETLFGAGMHAVRILEAAGFASLLWAGAILSRRHVGSATAGVAGATLALLIEAQLEFWHTAQPGSFAAVVLVWALVCASYEPRREDAHGEQRQVAAWLGAGALYGFAALLKPPFGGGLVVSLAVVATRRRRVAGAASRGGWLRAPALAMVAGAALPLAATVLYFVAKGAWGDLFDTLFVFAPHYTALSFRLEWLPLLLQQAIERCVFGFSLVIPVGLGLLVLLPVLGEREREGTLHVGGVAGVVLVGVAVQAKFFPYHFAAALALLALLAGWGIWKLWRLVAHRPLAVVAVLVLLGVLIDLRTATRDLGDSFAARCRLRLVALVHPALRDRINDHLYSVQEVNSGANREVAAWVEAHTRSGEPVYVWGFEPVIYLLAHRSPSSRYIYNVPQRVPWSRDHARQRLLSELGRRPPAVILVEHNDRFPWVTGDMLDSAGVLPSFPALLALLRRSYHRVAGIERFDIYVRNDRPGGRE